MADWFEPVKKDTNKTQSNEKWFTPSKYYDPAKVLKGVTPLYTKNQQIASPVSADLKSGTNSVGTRKMSAGLNYYVNGNPIPSKNPVQGVAAVNKAAEDYAKKATAGDGYESLSLDELKLKTEKAKKDYENGFKGENIIQTGLNILGGNNAYKYEYEKLREAYNNRINAFNEYNRNIALQKGEKTYDEKEYDINSKGALGKTVDVLEHIDNTVSAGGNMYRQGANATMNATLGNLAKAFGFKNNMFQQGYDYATYANNKANEKMELSARQLGDKNNISGTIGANIVNMTPDIIAMYLFGAPTLKTTLGLGAKSASLLTATQRGIPELAKNPMFFTSFAGEVGNDYYEAMANGATESQAMLAALTASTVNAALEVGGVQELPSKLLENKSLGKKTLDWVLSSLSEGKEEVLQDFISQLSAKAIYDKDKEVFSLSDQGAIINPERMAKEFGLGAAAGGLMGGGMLTFNSIVNSKTKAEYKQIGTTARKLGDVDGLINYAQRSIDNDIRTLAYNTDSESISDLELGQLYAYACRDIDGAINSPKELNIAIDNFNEIASSTDSKLINGIASSRIIERLTSAGIDSESAKYMAESANSQLQNGAESDIISSRGESYVRTDEFRRLQAESKGMSDEDIQLYHSGKREVDEELRKNISGILRSQIDAARNGVRNDYGILNLSAKGNQFNLYQNVDGELFHDVFEIARSYLRNGELVDLHGVNTTDEGIGYNDCFNYLSEDGLSGFSITPYGDLISVFNASGKSGFLNAIAPQVKEKVKTLDCYNSSNQPLMGIYSKVFGFKTASVMDYNMEYDHDNIAENHGNPQVAFMVNTDDEVEIKYFTKEQYDEAKEYRDGFVKSEFGTKSVFTEYSAKKYKADPIESYMFKEHGREKLSDDQLQIVMVARKLGHGVVFEDTAKTRGFKSDGYIENDGTIHIDYDNTKPVQFVFKHELTHYAEGSELYKNFVETVKASKTYKKWIAQKVNGEGSAAVKSAKYRQSVIDGYAASGIELTPMQAESELIADFVGDTLFTEDGTGLEGIMSDMNAKQRKSFVQYIKDFFAYIKDKLSRNKTATSDILKLEKMFNETLSAVEQKNTADENGVKYSIGFSEENNASETKQILLLINNSIEKISDEQVFDVADDNSIENFSKKTDYVMEVFNEQGNIAHNSVIGDVELSKSGAKSTIMHGFGREKLAAIKAIKPVIENGEVISKFTNYNNTGVDRYIIAAKGVINGEKAIVGVVVKSYPSKAGNSKFYLHEAEIIKTGSPVMTAPQLSVDTVSKSVSDITVPQKAQYVNTSISENTENSTEKLSDRDSIGEKLSDTQQEYFKNSKVRDESGNLKVMYRGDNGEFTVFDRKKSKSSNLYGRGFYFTDSKTHARQYGLSREFYLNIKNPLLPDQNNITKPQMLKFLKAIEDNGEEYDLYNYGENSTPDNVLNSVWGKGDFEMLQDINATAIGDLVAAVELFNEVNGTNYDGIILPTETITFNSNQAKLTSNENPTDNEDMRYSIPFNQAELLDKYDRGEISREEYLNQSNENWKEAVNNYGTIETGENPVNDIPVPKSVDGKQKTERFSRTVIESGKLTNRMVEDMGADILLGKFAYTPVSDESAQAAADKAVKGGFAESSWQEAVNASKLITKDKIAIGEKLLMQAIANKDTKRALELSSELADVLTRNGQNIQAASMFKKMTGAGKLLTVQQYVNTLNKDLEAKYGENAPTVKINELIAQKIAESKPGEDI